MYVRVLPQEFSPAWTTTTMMMMTFFFLEDFPIGHSDGRGGRGTLNVVKVYLRIRRVVWDMLTRVSIQKDPLPKSPHHRYTYYPKRPDEGIPLFSGTMTTLRSSIFSVRGQDSRISDCEKEVAIKHLAPSQENFFCRWRRKVAFAFFVFGHTVVDVMKNLGIE